MPRRLRSCLAILLWTLTSAVLAGVLVRTTVQDRYPLLAVVYYLSAWPILAVGLLMAAGGWWWRRHSWRAGMCLLAVGIALLAWRDTAWFSSPTTPPDGPTWRVMLWNLARGAGGMEALASAVHQEKPDIIGLIECVDDAHADSDFWQNNFPTYDCTAANAGMWIGVRGRIVWHDENRLGPHGKHKVIRAEIDGVTVTLVLVDFKANPFTPRQQRFAYLRARLAELDAGPMILMGDFNTPADSVLFESIRQDFRHAFETAGDGLLATWPVPVPFVALDHIWVRGLSMADCRLGWSWLSDHRPVIARIHPPAPSTRDHDASANPPSIQDGTAPLDRLKQRE